MRTLVICLPSALASVLALGLVAACGDPVDDQSPEEIITTVRLTFTPTAGGIPVTAAFDDPDGDGGEPPVVDPVDLDAGDYALVVRFVNRLEDPPEDITEEIADESDEHQVFFTGSAVDGPAADNPGAPLTQAYEDQDANGLPVGLDSSITAAAGGGDLVVTLRHLPPIGGSAIKTADLASEVSAAGFSAIGGQTDAQVSFAVTVQ